MRLGAIRHRQSFAAGSHLAGGGFTLIEILIAVLILAIALTALLQLHTSSLRTEELTRGLGWAERLARQKMSEALAAGPTVTDQRGEALTEGFPEVLRWTVTLAPVRLPELDASGIRGLSRVTVNVVDPNGNIPSVELVTYAVTH